MSDLEFDLQGHARSDPMFQLPVGLPIYDLIVSNSNHILSCVAFMGYRHLGNFLLSLIIRPQFPHHLHPPHP